MVKDVNKKKGKFAPFMNAFALPWCCILPIAVAAFGLAGGTIGVFLAPLTPYLLIISMGLIGYSNYNVWFGRFRSTRHKVWVTLITTFSVVAWLWSIIVVMKWIPLFG